MFGRAEAHRLPVKAAFQQHRPARVPRALMLAFHLVLQPVELILAEVAGAVVDHRARGPAALSSSAFDQRQAALCTSTAVAAA